MSDDYRQRHTGSGSRAAGYDARLFEPGTYEEELWRQERALLDRVVASLPEPRRRMLDFACGTGRVLAHLEDRFEEPVGLDISPDMLEQARPKMRRARLVCGDATRQPDLVEGPFDLITSFRFFLNAQPELRDQVLAWMAPRLRGPDARLFFNVHGNRWSSRQLVARVKRWQGKVVNWMTPPEIRRMVERSGLEIVDWWGLTYFDKWVFKRLPRFAWRGLEGAFRALRVPRHCAVNLYFACRRAT